MSLFDKLENLHGLDSPGVLPLDPFLALMSQVSPYTSKICFKKQNKTFNATVTLGVRHRRGFTSESWPLVLRQGRYDTTRVQSPSNSVVMFSPVVQ